MKRILITLALAGAGLAVAPAAHAQTDTTRTTQKPQLNTAPPGTSAPRPAQPAQRQQVPVPAPPPVDEPLPAQRNPNSPSGLEFPAGSRASEQPKILPKTFLYGNVGLGYSSYNGIGQFSASIGPSIGYRITDKFAVGPGISYSYTNYSFAGSGSLPCNSLGVKVFAQYIVYKEFFAHAEYEATRAESFDLYQVPGTNTLEVVPVKRTYRTPLLGAGYRSQLSDRFAADIVILYNFNDGYNADGSPTSPYGQPVFRVNFLYNLKLFK